MKKVTCTSSYVNSLFCGEESELSYITGSPWLTLALGTSYVPYLSAYTNLLHFSGLQSVRGEFQ